MNAFYSYGSIHAELGLRCLCLFSLISHAKDNFFIVNVLKKKPPKKCRLYSVTIFGLH